MRRSNFLAIRTLSFFLISLFLGCDSAAVSDTELNANEEVVMSLKKGVEKGQTIEEAINTLHSVDLESIEQRITKLINKTKNPKKEELKSVLTKEESEVFEKMYEVISVENGKEFENRYNGSIENVLLAWPEALACSPPALVPGPCDDECWAMAVSFVALMYSLTGGPIGVAIALYGFHLATDSAYECTQGHGMETCDDNPA